MQIAASLILCILFIYLYIITKTKSNFEYNAKNSFLNKLTRAAPFDFSTNQKI